jgi:two-component system response regulator YcbB
MALQFVVVDDDIAICKIIKNIIEEYALGTVVAECADGLKAEKAIREACPDIVLVDLLLPGQDGVELIKSLEGISANISFIVISESRSQQMITMAYETGIEFFIHKPINVIEVVSVINKTKERRNLKQALSIISQTTSQYAMSSAKPVENLESSKKGRIYRLYSDLGIIGDAGANTIYQMIQIIEGISQGNVQVAYQLNDIYQQLSLKINQDVKTIEQRVRRTIVKALQNVANLGLEDYYNEKFQAYSMALFDFKEIRREMSFIQGKGSYHGKINVKKFIEGLIFNSD